MTHASLLLQTQGWSHDILIDQGGKDQFYDLLRPKAIAGAQTDVPVTYCEHPG